MFEILFFSFFGILLVLHTLEKFFNFKIDFQFYQEYSELFKKSEDETGKTIIFHFLDFIMEIETYRSGMFSLELSILGLTLWIKIYREKDQEALMELLIKKIAAFQYTKEINTPPIVN